MKIPLVYDAVKAFYENHGYPFDEQGINVFGFRHSDFVPDKFDDTLGIAFPDRQVLSFSGTTDPGKSWLLSDEGNKEGVAILQPGFYKNCWHKGLHHGKYKALVQLGMGVFHVWRDSNKDDKLDLTGKTFMDVVGLNFHTTRWDKQVMRVGDFSAGCQVVEVAKEYDKMMIEKIYTSQQAIFSYALFQN
jgi:hypothetical protein